MRHVSITGYFAAGKSRLVERLAAATEFPTLAIDDVNGNWQQFRFRALRYPGPLILESVALPRWPLALLVYCRCEESERQRRLAQRDRPVTSWQTSDDGRYDYSRIADLVVDTTADVEIGPIIRRMRAALAIAA